MQRVLVTGASGFLGREMMRVHGAGREVVGVGHAHAAGLRPCDLRDEQAVAALIAEVRPDAVIHCAAYREPDFCEANPEEARRLNADAVGFLVRRLDPEAGLIHISTDYVFDGGRPPYREDDPAEPINVYGRTKREGEMHALAHPRALVLRVPLLIGAGPDAKRSGFITQIVQALCSGAPQEADDVGPRFPTWIRDVAEASRFLLDRGVTGIVHLSSQEKRTRYGILVAAAEALGMSAAHIRPTKNPPPRAARRPDDSHLAIDRWRSLGGPEPHGLADVMTGVVGAFGGVEAFGHG